MPFDNHDDREDALYNRLGGRDGIRSVVETFYDRVLDDDRVNHFFTEMSMAELRAHQTSFLASVTGGPHEYEGQEMREAHADLDLDGDDFDIIAEHLDAALAAHDVSADDRTAVVAEVESLRPAILDH